MISQCSEPTASPLPRALVSSTEKWGDASRLPLSLTWLGRGGEPPKANPSLLPSLGRTDPAIQFIPPPHPPSAMQHDTRAERRGFWK